MRLVLNVIWVLFGGIWLWLLYLVAGVIACVTIIGIPFGIANFKMIPISLAPLGKEIVDIGATDAPALIG